MKGWGSFVYSTKTFLEPHSKKKALQQSPKRLKNMGTCFKMEDKTKKPQVAQDSGSPEIPNLIPNLQRR